MDSIDTIVHRGSIVPIYCFKTEEHEEFDILVEKYFRMDEVPEFIVLKNGCKAVRDFQSERVSGTVKAGSDRPRGWPMAPCVGSGVNAAQAPELRAHFKKHNVDCEVTTDGDPIYTSAAQRKKALRSRGLHDRASYD